MNSSSPSLMQLLEKLLAAHAHSAAASSSLLPACCRNWLWDRRSRHYFLSCR